MWASLWDISLHKPLNQRNGKLASYSTPFAQQRILVSCDLNFQIFVHRTYRSFLKWLTACKLFDGNLCKNERLTSNVRTSIRRLRNWSPTGNLGLLVESCSHPNQCNCKWTWSTNDPATSRSSKPAGSSSSVHCNQPPHSVNITITVWWLDNTWASFVFNSAVWYQSC